MCSVSMSVMGCPGSWLRSIRRERSDNNQATSARAAPPMTMRADPTDNDDAPSGPSACAVPVVPKRIAAMRAKTTWRTQ